MYGILSLNKGNKDIIKVVHVTSLGLHQNTFWSKINKNYNFIQHCTLFRFCCQGQNALGLNLKYLKLSSEDERRSYGLGTTWGWVVNDIQSWESSLSLMTSRVGKVH